MKAKTKRLIVVLDEFPFIVEKFPEIVSVLQDKWDNLLKHTKLFLILSGSSVGMMEKYALDYKSPLYERRTGQWRVDKLEVRRVIFGLFCIRYNSWLSCNLFS